MKATKARQVRVYLHEHELELLDKLSKASGLKDTAVLSMLSTAALDALERNQFRFPFPLTFLITEPTTSPRK